MVDCFLTHINERRKAQLEKSGFWFFYVKKFCSKNMFLILCHFKISLSILKWKLESGALPLYLKKIILKNSIHGTSFILVGVVLRFDAFKILVKAYVNPLERTSKWTPKSNTNFNFFLGNQNWNRFSIWKRWATLRINLWNKNSIISHEIIWSEKRWNNIIPSRRDAFQTSKPINFFMKK